MISTHILDTTLGNPASGVKVVLEKKQDSSWLTVQTELTNSDGRIVFNTKPEAGEYRLNFHISDYFQKQQQTHFFTEVPVIFKITDIQRKYHVPLLLNPYGFSTYRGS